MAYLIQSEVLQLKKRDWSRLEQLEHLLQCSSCSSPFRDGATTGAPRREGNPIDAPARLDALARACAPGAEDRG